MKLGIIRHMKILYVITSTDVGGAEKALLQLAIKTAQAHTVRVVCLKPLGPVAQELAQHHIQVISLNMRWLGGRIIQKLAAQIKDFQPDIVHAMLYRAIEYARVACAGKKVKLITTPHFDLSKKSFPLRWVDRLLKDLDTLTVAESFSTARYLIEKQKYNKNKVYLLPNGVDKTVFYADESLRKQMRQKYGYTPEHTVFMDVARLAPVKDPFTLLKAFCNVVKNHPNARLVYVGEGEKRPVLEKFICQNGLEKTVLLAGKQDNINAWLNMADAFVLPSVEESLPLSLLESIQVGLPCLVSKVGDMPLWVEHGKNGFVFPEKDVTLLSCFMAELIDNAPLREQMRKCSAKISQRIGQNSQQYQQIYQQVLNNSFHVKTN